MVHRSSERIFILVSKRRFTDKCIRYMDENNRIYPDMKDITALFRQS